MADDKTFDEGEVMTALCLWEAWLMMEENKELDPELRAKMEAYRDEHGSFTLRGIMIELVADCDLAWEAREALTENMGGDHHISFDFDFCPTFIESVIGSGVFDKAVASQYGGNPGPYSGVLAAA